MALLLFPYIYHFIVLIIIIPMSADHLISFYLCAEMTFLFSFIAPFSFDCRRRRLVVVSGPLMSSLSSFIRYTI